MDQSNEDQLKVPAFMRKTEIKRRIKKKILYTALDRAQHEMMQAAANERQANAGIAHLASPTRRALPIERQLVPMGRQDVPIGRQARKTKKKPRLKPSYFSDRGDQSYGNSFLFGRDGELLPRQKVSVQASTMPRISLDYAGKISEFFDKIDVAVICLEHQLKEGDVIVIGSNAQEVSSMQINRKAISLARPGDDIGLKLKKKAAVGDKVFLLRVL